MQEHDGAYSSSFHYKKVRVDLHEKVRSEHKLAGDQGTRHSTAGLRQAQA